ncbi:MAG: efflux RND transporter periplasmic adaptor subunit [Raineya sp.]|nr:efflux RND transporter periplasmic adaptor subunit [Raineya sp.]
MMRLFCLVICIGAIFLQACSNSKGTEVSNKPKKEPPVSIEAMIVKTRELVSPLEVSGTLQAQDVVEIRSEVAGKLAYLFIPEGNFVAQGTILGRLYNDDLQAQLKKVQVQLELARKNEERLKKLLEVGGVNQQEYDQALTQIRTLEADADFIQAQIRKTIIVAPFAGKVGLKQVSLGSYVSPNQVLTTLQSPQLLVDFNVPEQYLSKVQIGNIVEVLVEGSSVKYQARILATEQQVNISTRNLKVRAKIENGDKNLMAGMFARVMLGGNEKQNTILIPTMAVIPETRGKKVVVIRKGKAEFVSIETGLRKESEVQVLNGLQAGDTIAVTGLLFLKPNSNVQIRKLRE